MNESLFSQNAFALAEPLVEPDFEVLTALARLRQSQSPTVRATAASRSGIADGDDYRLALFADPDAKIDEAYCRPAGFYDLSDIAVTQGWPLATHESRINLGISINVQSLPLNDAFGR